MFLTPHIWSKIKSDKHIGRIILKQFTDGKHLKDMLNIFKIITGLIVSYFRNPYL